jgi:hypothetical protein
LILLRFVALLKQVIFACLVYIGHLDKLKYHTHIHTHPHIHTLPRHVLSSESSPRHLNKLRHDTSCCSSTRNPNRWPRATSSTHYPAPPRRHLKHQKTKKPKKALRSTVTTISFYRQVYTTPSTALLYVLSSQHQRFCVFAHDLTISVFRWPARACARTDDAPHRWCNGGKDADNAKFSIHRMLQIRRSADRRRFVCSFRPFTSPLLFGTLILWIVCPTPSPAAGTMQTGISLLRNIVVEQGPCHSACPRYHLA